MRYSVNPEFTTDYFHVGNGWGVVSFGIHSTAFDLVERVGLDSGCRFHGGTDTPDKRKAQSNKYVPHSSSDMGEAILVQLNKEYKPPCRL